MVDFKRAMSNIVVENHKDKHILSGMASLFDNIHKYPYFFVDGKMMPGRELLSTEQLKKLESKFKLS